MPLTDYLSNVPRYDENYKAEVFLIWWKYGKPTANKLWNIISEDASGNHPTVNTLIGWIKDEFSSKAAELDNEFFSKIEAEAMQEKAEMLRRHTGLGTKMQDMAIEYLEEHKEELTINSATRLLIEGVRIERESRGIPDALDNLSEKTDDELLKELQKMMTGNLIDIQQIEDVTD